MSSARQSSPEAVELVDRPCPLCRTLKMRWIDDEWGYYCSRCATYVCIRRALGTVKNGVWTRHGVQS
ncbi:hypothetical protein CROSSROADS_106 [Mycobacterium phage Crossroads]|uniref:hypothetical protein n=1 Tax=Mycobacterium phage Crossroads TaxID=1340836 RepID=UPI0003881548|nr:hypothetical protein N848_gp106 [Mycobacterium phage Crossroads]AGT13104.1 hypothetical protein CROSSROADS_106 [Mycobacterium phage Crossroads]ALY07426.1 hypothetical protein SEA_MKALIMITINIS3_106 [Mycobacterium phage MkaliMitinis3]